MRIWIALLTLLLLTPITPELDAKKSWGGSKRTKSYSRSKKSVRKGSSFDQARSKKLRRERSSNSYKSYKAKKDNEKRTSSTQSSHPSASTVGAGIGATTGMAVASSIPQEIEYEVHNHYYGNSENSNRDNSIRESNSYSDHSNSLNRLTGFPSFAVILIILVILGVLYFILSKKSKENRKRVKEKLPIDLRMGAIVDLTAIETRLIINRENYLFNKPESLKGYVTSIGEVILDEDMKVYNLYISKTIDEKDHIFYIKFEIYKNRISNIKLFIEYEEVNPSTVEEWEEWLDGTEDLYPYIGGVDFSTPDGVAYKRVWERDIDEVVRSKFIEKFSIDGKESETLNMATLYDRKFQNGEVEYLYLLNIEDSELNNFIRLDLGIEIEQSELQIL